MTDLAPWRDDMGKNWPRTGGLSDAEHRNPADKEDALTASQHIGIDNIQSRT
jgi:hypothetical protein